VNLQQAIFETKCDKLRAELEKFLSTINNNVIETYGCPVCSTDLRSSFQYQADQRKHPGQGTCRVCSLGIQFNHHIEHVGHILDPITMRLCAYDITLPVALVNHVVSEELKKRWIKMGLPQRELTRSEFYDWMCEVQNIVNGSTKIN
jgi:hypothetical protein